MKKNLHILSITGIVALFAIILSSCGNKAGTPETNLVLSAADTTGLADFREWKAQNEKTERIVYVTQPAQRTVVKKTAYKTAAVAAPVQPATTRKKGWSKAAKGTVIGAVTGAAAGAIINKKNRVLGGVIGGVIGGGAGYGIGRGMDKKDGRF